MTETTPLLSWRWWRRTVPIYLMAAAGAAVAFVAGGMGLEPIVTPAAKAR